MSVFRTGCSAMTHRCCAPKAHSSSDAFLKERTALYHSDVAWCQILHKLWQVYTTLNFVSELALQRLSQIVVNLMSPLSIYRAHFGTKSNTTRDRCAGDGQWARMRVSGGKKGWSGGETGGWAVVDGGARDQSSEELGRLNWVSALGSGAVVARWNGGLV